VIRKIPAFLAHSQCKALARNDPYLHWHFIFRLAFWWLNWHPETTNRTGKLRETQGLKTSAKKDKEGGTAWFQKISGQNK
jgi:hypothetical protein